jgi:hypothetical protein
MPLCDTATVRVVNALLRDGEDALFGDEELLDGAFGGGVCAVGRVALERGAVERRNSALDARQLGAQLSGPDRRTHMVVSGPQQLLRRVKGEGGNGRGGMVWSWGWQLHKG